MDAARLETIGWGEERLKDPLNSAGAVNRRVEIVALGPFPKRDSSKRWSCPRAWCRSCG